jgi:hypothetical protein
MNKNNYNASYKQCAIVITNDNYIMINFIVKQKIKA